jgi:hypothetical protein
VVGAGCGDGEPVDPPPAPVGSTPAPGVARDEEDPMDIAITIGEQRLRATLSESAAARDLVAQLPATVDLTDHGRVEKTGPLPAPLSVEGDQSFFPGIVILGRLEGDAAQRLAELDGPVTAKVGAR